MKNCAAGFVLILLLSSSSVSDAADHSIRLIEKAYRNGEIDYQTAINYKIYALFNKRKLPRRYDSDLPTKSATLVILEALRNRHLLYKENAFILQRPTDSGDPDYYGTGIAVWTYDSPSGHFKVHYTEDNTNGDAVYGSDGVQSTVPQYVIDLCSYLDTVWSKEVDGLGYAAPPSDSGAGGDGRFDVYIKNLHGAYGYTSYDTSPTDVYIVIENDFTGFPANLDPEAPRKGAMKVTCAHEFFHAVQFQYMTDTSAYWWMEATATWMENTVFPSVKDYLHYLGLKFDDSDDSGSWQAGEIFYYIDGSVAGTTGRNTRLWFDHPEYSLDTYNGTYEYGTMLWPAFLAGRYGEEIIRTIWTTGIGTHGLPPLEATSEALAPQGVTLGDMFIAFANANYKAYYVDHGTAYADDNHYPIIKHSGSYKAYPVSITGTANHLSATYYSFIPALSDSTLSLTFDGTDSSIFAVALILKRADGTFEERSVGLTYGQTNTRVSGFGTASAYSKVVAVITNISMTANGMTYSINASDGTGGSGGGGGGDGGPCFIATAAFGSPMASEVMALRHFRDLYLMTNPAGRHFVSLYYRFSPQAADYISRHEAARSIARLGLSPLIFGIKHPSASIIILILGPAALYMTRRRRGG